MQLEELSHKVSQLLAPELSPHCQVGSFNKGCLVLTSVNAVWASQIRYSIPELRDKLRKEAGMYQLMSIKVVVIEPKFDEKKVAKKSSHQLTDKAKASIISESEHCVYQPLRKALLHLAEGDSSDC